MERAKLSPGRRLSLGAMVAALTLLFLYGSEVLTGFRFLCACFASFFVVILVEEDLFGTAWLCFLAVSILGFILCPDRISWFFYVALLGHYGIVRRFFQKFITVPSVRSVFTVLYCNLGTALALWALHTVAGVDLWTLAPQKVPFVVLILLVEAVFFLLDILFEAATVLYAKRVRRFLLK
ncbi:MAG: hypothetical protein IJR78_00275 [Clostridia bacterium]|nr:hypothetical protein [Clostridia bacterium]MBQ7754150.1 hypothetical protein [Clostridia bacterium]MBR0422981.1 hypothetical protein [Clostridia bacterium]